MQPLTSGHPTPYQVRNRYLRLQRKQAQGEKKGDTAWSKCPPGQCPKLGSCASSRRA